MNEKIKKALASVELEGTEFTVEQIQFISDLVEKLDSKEISWNDALKIIEERHKRGGTSNDYTQVD